MAAGSAEKLTNSIVAVNSQARVEGLNAALGVLAIIAVISLFFSNRIPNRQASDNDHGVTPSSPAAAT